MNWFNSQRGQTIIEVLVAAVIVSTVLTAIAVGLTFSVKTTADSRYRAYATKYAQETLEVFRRERANLGWESFVAAVVSGVYCYNTLPATSQEFAAKIPEECAVGQTIGDSIFTREADLTVTVDEVKVLSTVKWSDGNLQKQVQVEGTFRDID